MTVGNYYVLAAVGAYTVYIYPHCKTCNSYVFTSRKIYCKVGGIVELQVGNDYHFTVLESKDLVCASATPKLLIDRTRRYGDWTAILLSGLLFGLFHGNLFQFFYAALVGMILAYIYTRSGSYLRCVAMHAAINFMGSIVIPALGRLITPYLSAEELTSEMMLDPAFLLAMLVSLLLSAWQYGMLIAGITLFCIYFKHRKLSRGTALPEGGRASVPVLVNPGMIACLVIMLLLLAVNLIPVR